MVINEIIKATIKENEFIQYNNDNVVTTIDFINNIFSRKNDEFVFNVDFQNNNITYELLKENLKFEQKDLFCSIEIKNNIIIKYEFDGKRKIIIEFL